MEQHLAGGARLQDIDGAHRVLPLLRTIVRRIRRRQALRQRLERELLVLQLLSDAAAEPGAEFYEFVDTSVRYHRLGGQIDALVERLRGLGAEVRNRDATHVDFPYLRDDGIAALCWDPCEDTVTHWHPLHEPHETRRLLQPPP